MIFTGDWMSDLAILESYLCDLEYKTGTARLKKFGIKRSEGGSILYGYTFRGFLSKTKSREWCPCKKKFKTTLLTERPDLLEVFEDFRDNYFPGFEFSSVQLNYNYALGPHKDKNNSGESVLVCCGEYEGGATIVEIDGIEQSFDARIHPVVFDGSLYTHWVEKFEGDRYSVVFFRD